jgi:hypothetical protein|tara:strand:- start:1905 stop:2012 length:108 start_codon:yes stop_codon:yes gene_type:complete
VNEALFEEEVLGAMMENDDEFFFCEDCCFVKRLLI